MDSKSIKINLFMNTIVTILGVIFPLITFPYISRVLGPMGTGAVSYAASLASYFSMLAMLGVNTYGIKACAEIRNDRNLLSKVVQEIMFILMGSTIISYILFFIIVKFEIIDVEYKNIIYIYSVGIILQVIGIEWLYKALEQYTYIAIRSLIIKIISIFLMFILIKKKSDYPMYAVMNVFADGGAQLINFIVSFKYIKYRKFGDYNLGRHLSPLLIFFLTNVVHLVYTNLDIIMLEHIKGIYEVGIYNMALRIENILLSIVTALGVVVLPKISLAVKERRMEDFKLLNNKAVNYTMVISLFFIGIVEIMAPEIVYILGGDEYKDAILVLRILLVVLFAAGVANISGLQTLIPLGKEQQFLISVIWGAIVDFVLNIFLIKHLGNRATAFSTVMAEIVVLFVQFFYLKKNKIFFLKFNIKPILVIAITSGTVFYIKGLMNIENNAIYCIVMGIIYVVVWGGVSILLEESTLMGILKAIKDYYKDRRKIK